jgi:hypothetical protein
MQSTGHVLTCWFIVGLWSFMGVYRELQEQMWTRADKKYLKQLALVIERQ